MARIRAVVVMAIIIGGFTGAPARAATDEQKCKAAKLRAYATHYLCRQKAEAKAVLKSQSPDFSGCDATLTKALDKIESKFPGTDPVFGCSVDSVHGRGELTNLARRDAADMGCRLSRERRVVRIERAGSIVFVDYDLALHPTLSLRHVGNIPVVHAQCFYATSQGPCVGSGEFTVDIPAQSEVTWPAATGAGTIPAVPIGIPQGFLVCVEVDDAGVPIAGNTLIASVTDDERCAHDGLPIRGAPNNAVAIFTGDLCLDAAPSPDCPNGAEYEPCPFHPDGTGTPLKPQIEGCWDAISSFSFHCQ